MKFKHIFCAFPQVSSMQWTHQISFHNAVMLYIKIKYTNKTISRTGMNVKQLFYKVHV